MSASFGPMRFRAPLDADTRRTIASPAVKKGDALANWPSEAAALTGIWPTIANPPTIRPIFPGAMRFLASDPATIPSAEQIEVVDGRVTDACLARCTLTGVVQIQVQGEKPLKAIQQLGVLPPLGVPPTRAFYGPVRLSEDFLRAALLDHRRGMLPAAFYVGLERVDPSEPAWEALALHKFLSGLYEPVVRARDDLKDDDAARLPMPQLVVGDGGAVALGIALAWSRTRGLAPTGPDDPDLEVVPTLAFLRHVGRLLREDVTSAKGADQLMVEMIEDEETSGPWVARLTDTLHNMGFGDLPGEMPLGEIVREFQISAGGAWASVAKDATITDAKLSERNFGDLKAHPNAHVYAGPVSGRANTGTRLAIESWSRSGQRSPVLILAYPRSAIDTGTQRPRVGALPALPDLWRREETVDISLRMFAADFTLAGAGSGLTTDELEPIGHCARWKKSDTVNKFGPGPFEPSATSRVANAEVTPHRLLEVIETDLLNPLPPDDARLLALRSTFKVVRTVSEFECLGYLDQVNAYDDAGISFGPCHWSMAGAISNPRGNTELGGLAAYASFLAESLGTPDLDVFRSHGVTANASRRGDKAAAARQSSDAAFRSQLQFLDDRGEPVPMDKIGPRDIIPSWRSYHRWVVIGRRHPSIGRAAWGLSVRRLHAISAVPIKLDRPPRDERPTIGNVRTIGQVFTSELAMAQLMRWHIKLASAVAVGIGNNLIASDYIADAYREAEPSDRADPASWEPELIRMLAKQLDRFVAATGKAHKELPGNFQDIATPRWIDASVNPPVAGTNTRAYGLDPRLRMLSSAAGSFKLAKLPSEMTP